MIILNFQSFPKFVEEFEPSKYLGIWYKQMRHENKNQMDGRDGRPGSSKFPIKYNLEGRLNVAFGVKVQVER